MNDLSFFPILTEELINDCAFECGKYQFSYKYNENEYELSQKGKATVKLSEPTDAWKIEDNGLIIRKEIKITYPNLLYGKDGVAPTGSNIGICIIWTNRSLTQTGCIMPIHDIQSSTGRVCSFYHSFKKGEIKGDLELTTVLYIKDTAEELPDDETHLINEAGVTIGEIESISLDFNSMFMEFPIEECNAKDQPLWWVEFSQWEDPRVDLFDKENFCLYLNTAYDACPMVGENIKNLDLLIQIISMAYFLIFKRLSDDDLNATKNDVGLNPYSICSIMHQFILGCNDLHWESDESLLKSIQSNVEQMLKEGEN